MIALENLKKQAATLPIQDREALAEWLLDGVEAEALAEPDEEYARWLAAMQARSAAVAAGTVKTTPASEVLARLRGQYGLED